MRWRRSCPTNCGNNASECPKRQTETVSGIGGMAWPLALVTKNPLHVHVQDSWALVARPDDVMVNWAFKCQVQFWATLALPIKGPFAVRSA